jgi:hypothetical protein
MPPGIMEQTPKPRKQDARTLQKQTRRRRRLTEELVDLLPPRPSLPLFTLLFDELGDVELSNARMEIHIV